LRTAIRLAASATITALFPDAEKREGRLPRQFSRPCSAALAFLLAMTMAALGAALRAAPALAEAPPLLHYMDCARGLGVAINDKFAILPGERSGSRGLYVFTDQGAHFLPLGAPQAEDGEAQEFLLKADLSSLGELFVIFREKKPGSQSNIPPGIGYETNAPPRSVAAQYRETAASETLDERARGALRQRLKEKIAIIKEFIDNKNRYSSPAEARLAFERDRSVYLAKLARCHIAGDRELNMVVAEEVQKLETGFPGLTVWEKQIGVR